MFTDLPFTLLLYIYVEQPSANVIDVVYNHGKIKYIYVHYVAAKISRMRVRFALALPSGGCLED